MTIHNERIHKGKYGTAMTIVIKTGKNGYLLCRKNTLRNSLVRNFLKYKNILPLPSQKRVW